MANKRYAGIAAARHMSAARMTDESTSPETTASVTPPRGRVGAPTPTSRPVQSKRYRRQRAAAVTLISLILVSVPALAVLLFVYG
ncbi:hypothetical protein [Arthrobacter gengyunqii]|uniref:Uncharacterized protein n=1 Tax=Arthrobacter gengyunqii TaxID=2886940 RepID=A0ABS8GHI4_9MICC|nr:hypothetical protein [Arthrobacter gengyunqii]MCC3265457.1 hypothetical protein [Arthrobacter gengyunqii]